MLLCAFLLSLPLWECGLKSCCNCRCSWRYYVTPLVGVWIEIPVATFNAKACKGHSPCGSVDWNPSNNQYNYQTYRHSPCGSVDWNSDSVVSKSVHRVTPLVGVWIEIKSGNLLCNALKSLPLWECGLKCIQLHQSYQIFPSLPLWECGLK